MTAAITIIGSGFAAYQLVKSIRRLDSEVAIRILTADDGHDYNKPDLSHVFSKQQDVAALIKQSATEFAAQYQVDLHTRHTVTAVDPLAQVVTANGRQFAYSQLVMAVGAKAFVPKVAGAEPGDIVTLNSLDEFSQHQPRLSQARRVLLLGGGLIGVELALDLASAGKQVSVVEPGADLMANLLPEYVALQLTQTLQAQGVDVHRGMTLQALMPAHDTGLGSERAALVATLSSGDSLAVDCVLSAAGLQANLGLAKTLGLQVNRGICVDETLQTSIANIYALGDCAELQGQVRAFLQPAVLAASALAKTLLGQPTAMQQPNMMVKVKTPAYPIQLGGITGGTEVVRWQLDISEAGIVAKSFARDDSLIGFVVTKAEVSQAFSLLRQL